jgi:hypothetical protein
LTRGWHITRVGAVVLVVLAASIALAVFATGTLQAVGFIVAVLGGLLIAGEGLSGWGGVLGATRKSEVALRNYRPAQPPPDLGPTQTPEERDELWARARERSGRGRSRDVRQ